MRLHPALEAPLEVGDEARELRVVEPESRADLRLDHALVRVLQPQELRADLGEQREPVVRDQHAHEIAQLHGQVLRARGHEQVVELLRAEPGIVDPGPHLRVRRDLRHTVAAVLVSPLLVLGAVAWVAGLAEGRRTVASRRASRAQVNEET